MVERGMGDRGVARGPGGPPHLPKPKYAHFAAGGNVAASDAV